MLLFKRNALFLRFSDPMIIEPWAFGFEPPNFGGEPANCEENDEFNRTNHVAGYH